MDSSLFRFFLLSGCLLVSSVAAVAQSFKVALGDSIKSGVVGSEILFEARITNLSPGALTLAFVRTTNTLPAGWQSAMCVDALCFAPGLDSVALTPVFGCAPLRTGDSTTFSVHVTPQVNPGSGIVRVCVKNAENPGDSASMRFVTNATANSVPTDHTQPVDCALYQNYPNPFNLETTIGFRVWTARPSESSKADGGLRSRDVRLGVYDLLGREVAVLADGEMDPGMHTVIWNAFGMAGGVYWYRLVSGSTCLTRSVVLVK